MKGIKLRACNIYYVPLVFSFFQFVEERNEDASEDAGAEAAHENGNFTA